MNDTPDQIIARDWSPDFIRMMQNRIIVSHYKYGWMEDTYANRLADAVESLQKRLELYRQTGNTEWLVDVANFAMIEFMFPQHPGAHFSATDASESPGLVGISAKELLEES